MATTLLQGVNALLKRVGEVTGDANVITSLTDSPRQKHIDRSIQMFNEAIVILYDLINEPLPNELAESSITLLTSTRAYSLPTDLVELVYPLHDRTNGRYITEYPGGYLRMMKDQAYPANYTGLPNSAAIRPTDGLLYLDMIPTSAENGNSYTVTYEKSLLLSDATDTFPFVDTVFTMMLPSVAEVWQRWSHKDYEKSQFEKSLSGAAKLMAQKKHSNQWTRYRGSRPNQ